MHTHRGQNHHLEVYSNSYHSWLRLHHNRKNRYQPANRLNRVYTENHSILRTREVMGEEMKPATCLWLTGLPCSGKTTIAEALKPHFPKIQLLDGDVVRSSPLAQGTGFSPEERNKHIKRMGYIAKMLVDQGITVICSFVSPIRETRQEIRTYFSEHQFIEIYLSTKAEDCARRDVKGMYAKAHKGEIENFTGVSAPYEEPAYPEITLDTAALDLESCIQKILGYVNPWDIPATYYFGRWNGVFHNGHDHIIMQSVSTGQPVILAVRNVKPDKQNPWPAPLVKDMLEHRFKNHPNVSVMIVPDLAAIKYGRGVGYNVDEIKVTEQIAGISGTECRRMIAKKDPTWKTLVPPEVAEYLETHYT